MILARNFPRPTSGLDQLGGSASMLMPDQRLWTWAEPVGLSIEEKERKQFAMTVRSIGPADTDLEQALVGPRPFLQDNVRGRETET